MSAARSADDGSPLRVAFLIPSFVAGGAERVMIGFVNGLPEERFDRHLIVLSESGPLRPDLSEDVALHDVGIPRIRFAVPGLLRMIRRLQPDVLVVSASYLAAPLLVARRWLPRSTRLIVREANLPSLHMSNVAHPRFYGWTHDRLYPRADVLIASSLRMAQELSETGASPDQLSIVPNPVDESRIRARAKPPKRKPGPGRRFVAVGRLVPQKGFDRLLDVVAQLDVSDHCTIIGEGSERDRLLSRVDELGLQGRVRFPGFAENPWASMAGADALLMPSRTEGLPNVALEALACGTPVIATPESGGIAEIAAHAVEGAVTVLPIEDFAEHLASIPAAPPTALRPSLLPDAYHASNAVAALAHELERLTRTDL